ncbi:MAG: CsbD family protein [Myxococcaceae bacterium]
MKWDHIAGQWNEYRGKVKSRWSELTDDDLTTINGQRDALVRLVQRRYGKVREAAARDVEAFLRASDETTNTSDRFNTVEVTHFRNEAPNRSR